LGERHGHGFANRGSSSCGSWLYGERDQAITGYNSLAEMENYGRKADQVKLAQDAMKKQARNEKRNLCPQTWPT